MSANIISIIAQELDMPESEIKPESVLRNLAIDSLELAYLVLTLEDKLGIIIPDEEIGSILTVKDLIERTVKN